MFEHFDILRERIDAILTGDAEPQHAVAWFVLAVIAMTVWRHLLAHMK